MMDDYTLASKLFGSGRSEAGKPNRTVSMVSGVAVEDSSGGLVKVDIEGYVTGDEPYVYVPTGPSVKAGDIVQVQLAGPVAKTPFVANVPGWGDRIAGIAEQAEAVAEEAKEAAEGAGSQYFWQNASDPETYGGSGVHVTNDAKDDWVDAVADGFTDLSDQHPYHNILINSLGILMRRALNNLVTITRNAFAFYDGDGNSASNIVATFGASGAQIGKSDSQHAVIDSNGLVVYNGDGTIAKVNSVDVVAVKTASDAANTLLEGMEDAAESAGTTLNGIYADAEEARTNAAQAVSDASAANQAANAAAASADEARQLAENAGLDAAAASASAAQAGNSAQLALNNLAVTQDVVDALGRDVDDLQTHVAMTDDGLHIVPLESGYYVVLSTTSMQVRDPLGDVVAEYGVGSRIGRLMDTHIEARGDRFSFFQSGSGWSTLSNDYLYPQVENPTGSPADNGYYELVDGEYVPSTDTTVDSDKTYYRYNVSADVALPGEVAYIAVDPTTRESTFYMTRSVVVKDLRFGDWMWYGRRNRNMALKWMGGIV